MPDAEDDDDDDDDDDIDDDDDDDDDDLDDDGDDDGGDDVCAEEDEQEPGQYGMAGVLAQNEIRMRHFQSLKFQANIGKLGFCILVKALQMRAKQVFSAMAT